MEAKIVFISDRLDDRGNIRANLEPFRGGIRDRGREGHRGGATDEAKRLSADGDKGVGGETFDRKGGGGEARRKRNAGTAQRTQKDLLRLVHGGVFSPITTPLPLRLLAMLQVICLASLWESLWRRPMTSLF